MSSSVLRWDCRADGCFNTFRRPKFHVFDGLFPRRANFTDVDGMLEINGHFCLLEWKGEGGALKDGQLYAYLRFTRARGNVVFVVDGDAGAMCVNRLAVFWLGKQSASRPASIEMLRARLKGWANWAMQNPARIA